jgi:histidinol-phosphate/aromatic aminotransferase/cobyric acid decarboxylase-like protein
VVDRVYPSGGNFLLLRLRLDPAACGRLADALLERAGIYVKDASARFPDGRGFLRIGVRWPDENDRLVAALEAHGKP